MYSIFRATKEKITDENLIGIITAFNQKNTDFILSKRKKGDGIVCDISNSMIWDDQRNEIINFLRLNKSFIKKLNKKAFSITIDLAINHEDLEIQNYGLFIHHDNVLLGFLSDIKIDYEISVYK